MFAIGFLRWWYGPGWRDAGQRVLSRVTGIYRYFSLPILLRTLFQPWRRIISPGGGSLQQQTRAMLDNLVSRWVGFSIRILSLLAAVILMTAALVLGGILIAAWPLLPLASLIMVAAGLTGAAGGLRQ